MAILGISRGADGRDPSPRETTQKTQIVRQVGEWSDEELSRICRSLPGTTKAVRHPKDPKVLVLSDLFSPEYINGVLEKIRLFQVEIGSVWVKPGDLIYAALRGQ